MFIIKRTTQKKHYFQKEEIQILRHWTATQIIINRQEKHDTVTLTIIK